MTAVADPPAGDLLRDGPQAPHSPPTWCCSGVGGLSAYLRGRQRDEAAGAPDVLGVARATFRHPLLQGRLAGAVRERVRHGDGREDGQRALPLLGGDQVQPPPDARVAEVVRVARVTPQPAVHHLALGVGVGPEARQLPVADRLEEQADGEDRGADPGEHARTRLPSYIATWTGNETNHMTTPWVR